MADYKQINKELIDSNRELKQLVATLQKELVLMRADLMEQHRMRVEAEYKSRERILTILANTFVTSVYEIDADINIMQLLGYKDKIGNSNSASANGSEKSGGSGSSSRRSTQLVKDFRRTSAALRQQSVVQISPTRRVQDEDHAVIEEEHEYLATNETGSDMDLDDSCNVIDVENEDDTRINGELLCINEGSDEESMEYAEIENKSDKSRKQYPLRDLSNETNIGHVTRAAKEREHLNVNENSIEVARDQPLGCPKRPTQYDLEIDLVDSMRRSLHLTLERTSIPRIAKQIENLACIEKSKKHPVVRLQRLHAPTPHIVVHNATEDTIIRQVTENAADITSKNDATELSLGLTEYSVGNFLEAHCSTPCNKERTKTSSIQNIVTGSVSATLSDEAGNTLTHDGSLRRPSRKCTPRMLVEPSLRHKLRSDNGKTKLKSKKR